MIYPLIRVGGDHSTLILSQSKMNCTTNHVSFDVLWSYFDRCSIFFYHFHGSDIFSRSVFPFVYCYLYIEHK